MTQGYFRLASTKDDSGIRFSRTTTIVGFQIICTLLHMTASRQRCVIVICDLTADRGRAVEHTDE